ncbi:hypothetical protein I4U23_016834 [Adineta vaga]|nr:hypothetical protein I4U23_016834 [Adineta vaga]
MMSVTCDKELVYQIEECLEKDNFRVWLDRDNMYSSPTHCSFTFDEAYSRSVQEIAGYRSSSISIVPLVVNNYVSTTTHAVDIKPSAIVTATTLSRTVPHVLSLWSQNDVKYILESKNLDAMLPICTGLNGSTLCALHTMCRMNSNVMYDSLKRELAQSNSKILPIGTFFEFMKETKKYVLVAPSDTNAVSMVCSLV